MSVCRKLPDGTIQKIAGHTVLLDANASEVREGRASFTNPTWGSFVDVTFSDPMPDTDYKVILEYPMQGQNWGGNSTPADVAVDAKTTTGFRMTMWPVGTVNQVYINWTAFKPVKIEGYTALQNKVNNPDDTPTIDSMNLVTSDGVARAIENASAVWKGTRAEWNALPATTKIKYDLAVLLDTQLIKSVDRTDGTDSNVADLTGKIFRGTEAEWNALSAAEKDEYEQAETCDVEDPVVVFDPSTVIKPYMNKDYNLSSGEPSNVPAFSPTGWFNTGLKVDTNKVAVVLRHQHGLDSNGENVWPLVPYNVSNDTSGNLIFQFVNISDVAKECVKCRVWFNLIGKPSDLPSD